MDRKYVRYEGEGRLAIVTIDNPKMNALGSPWWRIWSGVR